MSDPRQVPPSPGTTPRASKHRDRPYRESPEIWARHRREGTRPLTEGEIDARIVANAADTAVLEGGEKLAPPFLAELVSIFEVRVRRALPVDTEQRVREGRAFRRAIGDREAARVERREFLGRRRELESERRRLRPPLGGSMFTQPAWLLACIIPAFVMELLGSRAALEAAFDLEPPEAIVFAASIPVIMIVAADQLGNLLVGVSRNSRSWSIFISSALALLAVLAAVATIWFLTDSRATNTAFQQAGERPAEAGQSGLKATTADGLKPAEALKNLDDQRAERASGTSEPDVDFFVPLSVLILAASTLLAFRIEGAAAWNELSEDIDVLAGRTQRAEENEARAEQAAHEATAAEQEAAYALAAHVERERGLLVGWLQRFAGEYQRFCALEGHRPRELTLPQIPLAGDVLNELLYPDAGAAPPRRPRPDAGGDGGERPGPPPSQGGQDDRHEGRQRPGPGGGPENPRQPRGRSRRPDGQPPG